MEPRGEQATHQLSGTPGSLPGSEVFCERQNQCDNPPQDGQYVSVDVHQQPGGDDLPTAEPPSQGAMAVVHGEEHPPQSPAPSRCIEHHCRRRVSGHEMPKNISLDRQETGPSGAGSVCQQVDTPAAMICQLETGSGSDCYRCIHAELGRVQSICQPPWNLIGRVLAQTRRQQAELVLVATPDSPEEGSGHSNTPGQPPRGGPPTGHVGYLRQRYRDCQISEGATKLLLASWRQKSFRTYDSLFGKWVSWCGEQDCDPISCPIGEVINFLAHLFEQGYQYRSISAYRSAISSVHEKVDGYEVGQHPMVSRVIKGIFHERPPQPRYSETWDVSQVTSYIESLGETESLSLADLTHKTVMLMALTRPSRSADISQLDLRFRKFLPEGVSFQPTKLAKQSRQSRPMAEFFFPAFTPTPLLCPVATLRVYEERTQSFR